MPHREATEHPDLTALFEEIGSGDPKSINRLFAVVYDELRAIAHNVLRRENRRKPLETTTLVHEAFLRLCPRGINTWQNRHHFFGAASRAMRRILVDECRRRKSLKRGGDRQTLSLNEGREQFFAHENDEGFFDEIEALHVALKRFESHTEHVRQVQVVEYRYFVGLTARESADILGVSENTVNNDWAYARAWLKRALIGGDDG